MTVIAQTAPEQAEEVRAMLKEYLAWTHTFGDDSASAPTFEGVDEELENLPGIFAPPQGRLLLALVDGKLAGCVALKPHDAGICELKRLYVRPEFRGLRLGEQLVSQLLREARGIGYRKIVLDSHKSMATAHRIYRAAGFQDAPAPPDFPEALKPIAIFMERAL